MKTITPLVLASCLIIVFSQNINAKCQLIKNIIGYSPNTNSLDLTVFNWLAFDKGKVIATGESDTFSQFQSCHIIDGQKQYLLPGLIDAHGHISGLGNEMLRVKLRGVSSESAAVEMVKSFAQENKGTQWILGRGWNQVLWSENKFPNKASLDQSGIDKPIMLNRVDGHATWVNSKALALAGITKSTPDPQGGKIVRDEKGEATGVLIDNAINLVASQIPTPSLMETDFALDKAFAHLLSLGIVSVHDAGIEQNEINTYLQRNKNNSLPIRVYAMLNGASPSLNNWLNQGPISDDKDFLSIKSVKLYSDGALGSRGAALLAPYSDDQDNKGLLLIEPDELNNVIQTIISKGFQTNVHAIGDRGNRLVLDAFAKAYEKIGGKELRNRIEHAQVVSLQDIPRFKELNIIASMQPVHATSDKNMAGDRIGSERLKGAYAWQKFIQQGTVIASGSDFPVELANAFHGLHAAITRQDQNGQPESGWLAGERMTPTQALRSFTLDAAYAAHQEKTLGSLEKGKWADFILVNQDIINGKSSDIWKTKVLETWIAGELRYKK